MKIALAHDFLTQNGGAEKVVESFKKNYPQAPLHVLFSDKKKFKDIFPKENIKDSFLQKYPFILSKYKWYLPFMASAIESFDFSEYDVVLSSASAFAKGILTNPETVHVCYCHTPTRYLWTDTQSYIKNLSAPRLVKKILPFWLNKLRIWDKMAAERVDYFVANSYLVQKRIWKYYNRPSEVIYPPVQTHKFKIADKVQDYFLAGGRLVNYKKIDLIVKAFNRLGLPLCIYGSGPEYKNLKKLAKDNIKFLGRVSDEKLAKLYSEAQAYIQPQVEDFGITAVESMASGRPVIAYAKGGSLETVKAGLSGMFFKHQDWASLAEAVLNFNSDDYNPEKIKAYAQRFSEENFQKQIHNFIVNKAKAHKQSLNIQQLSMEI